MPLRPSEAQGQGRFDRVAEWVDTQVSRAPYFLICCTAVIAWAASGPLLNFSEGWQLVINTSTTILTFLMVSLAANAARRSSQADQRKSNAIADALADFMEVYQQETGCDLQNHVDELREAVGIEERESA